MLLNKGGLEDTRLEAKAKGHKKNPRSKTDHPRADSIEAKYGNARGQGHNAQVFVKQATTVLRSKNRKFSAKIRCSPKKDKKKKKKIEKVFT